VILTIFFGEFEDAFGDGVWVRNVFEVEALGFAGGLDIDITEVEHGSEEAFDFACDILGAIEAELGDRAMEKAGLIDVDDAFIGYDKDIEPIVHEGLKEK